MNWKVEDYGARYYDAVVGRWLIPDELGEIDFDKCNYNYVGGNPISRIDPDGRTWLDDLVGFTNALVDNASLGFVNLRDSYHPTDPADYNDGQNAGDVASMLIGTSEAEAGSGMMAGAVLVAPETAGLSAPAFVAGAGAALHGSLMGARGVQNLLSQKGRKGPKDLVGDAKQAEAKKAAATERQEKRQAQTERGKTRTGNNNQGTRGSHSSMKGGNKGGKHPKAEKRRAREQKKADEKKENNKSR
ncbi:MAG: hypothetical protein KA251_02915 [Saprospiraceae bacterium]|nr:hypothetical protein [Bacteroidota bacterium]MBP6401942.1 hypothetical protein [Bacteroidia bacterium]MBP6521909.1 hypothetical protein [Saprospiraceae bacterium]